MDNTTSVSSATEPHRTGEEPNSSDGMTVRELLDRMEAAYQRTSTTNPHRNLWFMAAQVIVQQAQRIVALEKQLADQPRIVLPG